MYVYVVSCLVDGRVYVGKSIDPYARWAGHKASAKIGKSGRFYDAIREHGTHSFELKVVERCEDEHASTVAERVWIAKLEATDPLKGYNRTVGGNGPRSGMAWKSPLRDQCKRELADKCWELYSQGLPVKTVGAMLGYTGKHVHQTMRNAGYVMRDSSRSHLLNKTSAEAITAERCIELYSSGMTLTEVGDRLGCSNKHVQRTLEKAGHPRRSTGRWSASRS